MKAPKAKSVTNKDRSHLLDAVTSRTKVIALIILIIEALFLAGAYLLPESQRITAFIVCGALLGIALIGCIWLERSQPEHLLANEPHYEPAGDRANALLGTWTGIYNQPIGPNNKPIVNATIQLTFTSANHMIEGTGRLEGLSSKLNIKFRGGFLHNRFLRLDYENVESDAIQFGGITAELSEDSHSIEGAYAGFGATSRQIVYGTIKLTR